MLGQIGVLIMSVSFAIFAVALSKLLYRTSSSIEAVRLAIGQMESNMDGTLEALEETLNETSETVVDMEMKLTSIESVFESAELLGEASSTISGQMKNVTEGYALTGHAPGTKKFIHIIQSAEFAKSLIRSWKRGQSALAAGK